MITFGPIDLEKDCPINMMELEIYYGISEPDVRKLMAQGLSLSDIRQLRRDQHEATLQ